MGKDKVITKSSSTNTSINNTATATTIDPKKIPRGHKQKGSGNVIVLSKPSVVTNDGVVIKSFEKLPCQILHEYCQKEKRSLPRYKPITPACRYQITLEDAKNIKNNLVLSTNQSFDTDSIAKDYAALLVLFHLQKNMPLERKLPEPYQSTWLQMIKNDKDSSSNSNANNINKNSNDIKTNKDSSMKQDSIMSKSNSNTTTTTINITTSNNSKNVSNLNDNNLSNTSNSTNNNNMNNPNNHTMKGIQPVIPVTSMLDRATSDWLCDQCGVQNYNLVAVTGQVRMKCFRCQTNKSNTCQLVITLSSSSAITTSSNGNSNYNSDKVMTTANATTSVVVSSSDNKLSEKKTVPQAILDLRATKLYHTVAEEEQQRLIIKQNVLRKQRYFDALRRANRPMMINIPMNLRKTLENILGITSTTSTSTTNLLLLNNNNNSLVSDAITNCEEMGGIFPEHLCNIPKNQQSLTILKICTELINIHGWYFSSYIYRYHIQIINIYIYFTDININVHSYFMSIYLSIS